MNHENLALNPCILWYERVLLGYRKRPAPRSREPADRGRTEHLVSTSTSPIQRYSTCTGLDCFGVEIEGHVTRCPRCQSTLVTHHGRREPMTTAELDARANARAREQHVHIFSVPG